MTEKLILNLRNLLMQNTLPTPADETWASVFVLIGRSQGLEPQIILTKRTHEVETHKGHVSFPGGYFEREDKDSLATAYREAFEEIGIYSKDIEYLGVLKPAYTKEKIPILPYVGLIWLPYCFQVNTQEVEKIIFLPLKRLLQEELKAVKVPIEGITLVSEGIWVENELVWGATARILKQFKNLILQL